MSLFVYLLVCVGVCIFVRVCIGDVTNEGIKIGEKDGHYNANKKPPGRPDLDTRQIFVSPSIRYAANNSYATPET